MAEAVTEESLSEEERSLRELYGCDFEQIAWLRWSERVKLFRDPDKRKQEYSSNWREAFCTPAVRCAIRRL
jgi:hypothetical protein